MILFALYREKILWQKELALMEKNHSLGYQEKSLEARLAESLKELGWHSFKEVTMTVLSRWHSVASRFVQIKMPTTATCTAVQR